MIPKNPMNCHNCDYHKMNDDPELHCYMFKNEPSEVCMVFRSEKFKERYDVLGLVKETLTNLNNLIVKTNKGE